MVGSQHVSKVVGICLLIAFVSRITNRGSALPIDYFTAEEQPLLNIQQNASNGTSGLLPSDTICTPWHVDMDNWWTYHPEYDEGTHNETHQCFDHMKNAAVVALLYQIHTVQFHSDCAKGVAVRRMWSSGWYANFINVADGLLYAIQSKIPLQMTLNGTGLDYWNYAAVKGTGENATCPQKDMSCYFLPLSNCQTNSLETEVAFKLEETPDRMRAFHYATRSLQWLRRKVYEYLRDRAPKDMHGPCSIIHVRRSDVVIENHGRKFYNVSEYIVKLPKDRREPGANVLLLTDDANAIDEAWHDFPDLKWHYLDRPRFRGQEGGWENHFPSNDPALEVIVIKAIQVMVQQCDIIVHGLGGFSDFIYDSMKQVNENAQRISVEK